jgi:chorismate-pyruvate lyase
MRPTVTVQALHEKLLASDSATEVLAELFGSTVVACRLACDPLALTPWQRAQLAPTQSEPACHRRVTLLAGGTPVSEADLWYVPARLLPGMADTLTKTDEPFGAVVRPMRPARETLAWRLCAPGEPVALEHEALLRDREGRPIALVAERYLPGVFPA